MVLVFCGVSCLFISGRPLAALEKATSALAQKGRGGINVYCAHHDVLSLPSPGGRKSELRPELVAPGLAVALVLSWSARTPTAQGWWMGWS